MGHELASLPRDLSVHLAAQLIEDGSLSPLDLAEDLLRVIGRLESDVHAWAFIDPQAVRRSAEVAKSRGGEPRQELRGIPVGVKDNFMTAGVPTEAGSATLRGYIPTSDARVVELLKAAGAYVMGKTICTEFATADPGPTRNPWNLAHTPGGSSSGSAAAVSARMVPAAIGTQTGGSLLRPAAYNGIVAVKPTYGRISREGLLPVSWSLDTVGVLTRSVRDADLLLSVLVEDQGRAPESTGSHDSYRSRLGTAVAPSIALISSYFLETCDTDVTSNIEFVLARLRSAGATVSVVETAADFARARSIQMVIDHAECSSYHRHRFRDLHALYSQNISQRILTGASISAVDYLDAQRVRSLISGQLIQLVSEFDVVMTPSTPATAPRGLASTGDPSFQSPWSLVGLPALTLPSGLAENGLPLGIQLVGKPYDDAHLLAVAEWCERALDVELDVPSGVV